MKEYTYQDMVSMQEDAVRRVQEMHMRSRKFADEINSELNEEQTENRDERAVAEEKENVNAAEAFRAASYRAPVQRAKSVSLPVDYLNPDIKRSENRPQKTQQKNSISAALNNIFGDMSEEETEKMFLLALCLLLSAENADEPLIYSLMYLLI